MKFFLIIVSCFFITGCTSMLKVLFIKCEVPETTESCKAPTLIKVEW